MIEDYFERITHNSRPHEVFNKEWSSYSSRDFADTFLPYAKKYTGSHINVYDGAELFKNIPKKRKRLFSLNPKSSPNDFSILTFADGQTVSKKKHILKLFENELLIIASVNVESMVSLNFNFGKKIKDQFSDFLKKSKINTWSLEKSYKITKVEFESYFSKGMIHFDVMGFIFKTLGFEYEEIMGHYRTLLHYSDEGRGKFDTDGVEAITFDAGRPNPECKNSWTHGNIAHYALKAAGFNGYEILDTYYGNWLRDFSSTIAGSTLGFHFLVKKKMANSKLFRDNNYAKGLLLNMQGKLTHQGWVNLIELLGASEFIYERSNILEKGADFNRYLKEFRKQFGTLTKEKLGVYRPEEHIDNPKGLPDDSFFGASFLEDSKIVVRHDLPKGGRIEQTLSRGETKKGDELKIDVNLLKNYIVNDTNFISQNGDSLEVVPSSLNYFIQQIELAIEKGRNKKGFLHLGAALHVLEDYYAHTNFVELSLIKIADKVSNRTLHTIPWVQISDDIKKNPDGYNKASKIPIVTGVFGTDDMKASMYPKIEKMLLPINKSRKVDIKSGDRTLINHVVINVLTDYIEQEKGMPEEKKYRDPYLGITYDAWLESYLALLNGDDALITGTTYVSEKTDDAIEYVLGEDKARKFKDFKRNTAEKIGEYMEDVAIYRNFILRQLFSGTPDEIKNNQTKNNRNFGTNPTHTQLAKDHCNHHFNHLAGLLAKNAVESIAKRIVKCWSFNGQEEGNAEFEALINDAKTKYFVHPINTSWMDESVIEWALKYPEKVKTGTRAIVHKH